MENIPEKDSAEAVPLNVELASIGGPVWVNFVNTAAFAQLGFQDVLSSDAEFKRWLVQVEEVSPSEPFFEGALGFLDSYRFWLRESISAILQGKPIPASTIELSNGMMMTPWERPELVARPDGKFDLNTVRDPKYVWGINYALAKSFAETLANGDLSRLRKCASPDCLMHFYDDSKNGARRWCSMSVCGNRAKAAKHYERSKSRNA